MIFYFLIIISVLNVQRCKRDIELINTINNNPELFKLVI